MRRLRRSRRPWWGVWVKSFAQATATGNWPAGARAELAEIRAAREADAPSMGPNEAKETNYVYPFIPGGETLGTWTMKTVLGGKVRYSQ